MAEANKIYAVVTGANKGIGLATVQELASRGITVVLTARNERRGLDAVQKLKQLDLKGEILFHQLDVADQDSVNHFSDFINNNLKKLDILVNNAAVSSGFPTDVNKYRDAISTYTKTAAASMGENKDRDALSRNAASQMPENFWEEIFVENHETISQCLNINYYGTKRMCEAMIPFLQLSDFPRIVNVSSSSGRLQNITNERAKSVLSNIESLSEEKIDELLNEFVEKATMGVPIWTKRAHGYTISKTAVNAYTRLLSKEYPLMRINAVCPGFVKTDLGYNSGVLSVEEGADSIVNLALSGNYCPTGMFFYRKEESSYE